MKTYQDMLRHVLDDGELISNGRTKEGYYSVFGYQNRYNLREGFPAITTKKLFFRGVAVEMIWFLSGDTNVQYLQDNNVHIWDAWATAEQTAKFGRDEGELGPVYGELWRKWQAITPEAQQIIKESITSITCNTEKIPSEVRIGGSLRGRMNEIDEDAFAIEKALESVSIDQIARVVDRIKTNPSCRRLIVSGWNPATCDKVALPPCHTLFQFRVSHGGTRLNCQLYQRSADAAVGVPFNIASYALLTHMVAQVTGLEVGEFIHSFGDLHIYKDHVPGVREQLTREPMPLAKLWLNPDIKKIDDFKPKDIKLLDYTSHPAIPFTVAV